MPFQGGPTLEPRVAFAPRRILAHIVVVAVAGVVAAGCGNTYIDDRASSTTAPASTTTPVTIGPVDPNAPVDELIDEMTTIMFDLDERIIENDHPKQALERIDELWAVIEPQLDNLDAYRYGQAVELATEGVNRRQPADASKGYKILNDLTS